MKITAPLYLTTTLLLAACTSESPNEANQATVADTVYINGRIYTVNEAQPWAEATAIKDGKFIVVGSNADVEAVTGEATVVTDLGGKFAMPGFVDAHLHVGGFYVSSKLEGRLLRFPGGSSKEEMQLMLKDYAEQNPQLKVIVVENYNSGLFPGGAPPKEFLDEVVSDRPVIAISDTEHEALLNSVALERAGITAETEDPPNGKIIRNSETGEPAGTLKEAAAGRWAWSEFPAPAHKDHVDGQRELNAWLNSIGITAIKVQHADLVEMAALRELDHNGELTVRAALSWTWLSPLNPKSREELEEIIANRSEFRSDRIDPDFAKINIDGTPTGTAYMLEPYEYRDDRGEPFVGLEELADVVARFDAEGVGVTFHVMGDAGMRLVIDAIEIAAERNGGLKARHQLAHASLIAPEDIQRIVELGLPAEFSAPDIHYDQGIVEAVEAAIGPERFKGWFPVKQLFNAGGIPIIASDGPLFWLDPLDAVQKMVLRPYPGGENLTIDEVIASMTINAAYAMDAEDAFGSLEVGKQADMIVLDENLFEIPADNIGETDVVTTIFNGKIVFERP